MSVRAPATAQARMTPPADGTRAVISDAWTKIDAPMIVPTTRAVADGRPMTRASWFIKKTPGSFSLDVLGK